MIDVKNYNITFDIRRLLSLSKLTPYQISLGLTHLDSEAFICKINRLDYTKYHINEIIHL